MNLNNIENIAFSGGGVRIAAEVGAYSVLEEKGILKQSKRFGGTSAGAIIALMATLDYKAVELKQMIDELDFKKFKDGGILEKLNISKDFGLYKGQYILDFIEEKILQKTGSKYTTFAGLYAKGFKELTVFATNLNTQSLKVFNYKETPNVAVSHAVRCSMCIPLFFEVFKVPHDNNIYVDGGCLFNYPLNYYEPNNTIGITFNSFKESEDNHLKSGELEKFIKSFLSVSFNSQAINLKQDEEELNRSVIIDHNNISAIDFDINKEQKQLLFNSGKEATEKFFIN